MERQTAVVDDFSGGITDYPLDAKPNQASECDNLVINVNNKLDHAPGSRIFNSSFYQVPLGQYKVQKLITPTDGSLLVHSNQKLYVSTPSSVSAVELQGTTGNPAFNSCSDSNYVSSAEWGGITYLCCDSYIRPQKVYRDSGGTYRIRNAGLPDLASSPTVTSTGGTGSNYIYALLHYYTYTVNGITYEDFGPTTQIQKTNIGAPNANTVNITAIPVLANGSTENWDTASIKIKIYRTIAGGTNFFYVGEVTNGTTSYSDTTSDATLTSNNVGLYINGGVVDNDIAPKAKYIHIVSGRAYYGNITEENGEIIPNRVRQAILDDPDSCPADFYVDMLDDVMGISSFNDSVVVFGKNKAYRLVGEFNELGQGGITYEEISKTIGCVSADSIIQTKEGIIWAGNDGFYVTDGFKVNKISDSINERYKKIVATDARARRIVSAYDKKENRVYFAVSEGTIAQYNDKFYVLHLRQGVSNASSFTTRSNGDDFQPTCLAFYNNQILRGDYRGYIFKHDSSYTTDPLVDTTATATSWNTKVIIPFYKSIALNGGADVRKWVTNILLTMENSSNASVQIKSYNDNSGVSDNLKEIRFRSGYLWGDPLPLWGDDSITWNDFKIMQEKRWFTATNLRCYLKQIVITSSYTNIYRSDDFTTVTTNNTANTVVTNNSTTYPWPDEVVGYYISFDSDSYATEYKILSRTASTLTIQDINNTMPTSGTSKWLIRGYRKSEQFNILSYIIYFSFLTNQSFKMYRTEQDPSGANA